MLLNYGAQAHVKDSQGRTPLEVVPPNANECVAMLQKAQGMLLFHLHSKERFKKHKEKLKENSNGASNKNISQNKGRRMHWISKPTEDSISIVSYNILAQCNVIPSFYPYAKSGGFIAYIY